MQAQLFSMLIAVGLSAVGVLADYFLKLASLQEVSLNRWLFLGALAYASTAVGWVICVQALDLRAGRGGLLCFDHLTARAGRCHRVW